MTIEIRPLSRPLLHRAVAAAAMLALLAMPALAAEGADTPKPRVETGHAFGRDQGVLIRAWFAHPANLAGLPASLADRESLPPGLRRKVDRNKSVPSGLEKWLHPLPEALESSLPALPAGFRRVVLGNDVIIVDDNAGRVRDILRNVLS